MDELAQAKELLLSAQHEIKSLRDQISFLKPKAEAWDTIRTVVSFVPYGGPNGYSVDLAWRIDEFLNPPTTSENTAGAAQSEGNQ